MPKARHGMAVLSKGKPLRYRGGLTGAYPSANSTRTFLLVISAFGYSF